MKGDIDIRCAYGAGLSIVATLKNLAGAPVDVTGYSARLVFLRFNDSSAWLPVLSLSSPSAGVSVGGVDGRFTATATALQTSALSSSFGLPPSRIGRYEFRVTPPAGVEVQIMHGEVTLLHEGGIVPTVSQDVVEETFTISTDVLVPAGPPGASIASLVTNDSGVAGPSVADALKSLGLGTAPGWNVKYLGVLNDGSDTTTALQAAVNYAFSQGGGTLFFPAGTYGVKSTIIWPAGVNAIGAGFDVSVIKMLAVGQDPQDLIQSRCAQLNVQQFWNTTFRDISLWIANTPSTQWAASSNAFSVGQFVQPAYSSYIWLKLVAKSGVTGAFRPIGQLEPSSSLTQVVLSGSPNANYNVVMRVTTPGRLGTMQFQVATDGATFGAIQTTANAQLSTNYVIPGTGLTIIIAQNTYSVADYIPTPSVVVSGTADAARFVDVNISTAGPLGTMQFRVATTGDIHKLNGGGLYGAPVATVAGASFTYAIPGTTQSVTFYAGQYTSNMNYYTASCGWSLTPGTQIVDGGCTWQVYSGCACYSNIGGSTLTFERVKVGGGSAGFFFCQSSNWTLRACRTASPAAHACAGVYKSDNSDVIHGAAGGFNNVACIDGGVIKGGIISDGGLGFLIHGMPNVSSGGTYGWIFLSNQFGMQISGLYLETPNSSGLVRNTCFSGRSSSGIGYRGFVFSGSSLISQGTAAVLDIWSGQGLFVTGCSLQRSGGGACFEMNGGGVVDWWEFANNVSIGTVFAGASTSLLGFTGSNISNLSGAAGVSVTDSLNTLNRLNPRVGTVLTDANVTRQPGIAQNLYQLPAATLTVNRQLTLNAGGTGIAVGMSTYVQRSDLTANTYAIINGGPGAGTMFTFPASPANPSLARFSWDGTNFAFASWEPLNT